MRQGEAVLEDLARHPATAHFIATKLVRHFIADDPPPAAVDASPSLPQNRRRPAAGVCGIDRVRPRPGMPTCASSRRPEDFVFSTLRALDMSPRRPEEVVRSFDLLGQRQYTPGSPAGWPDTSKSWDGSDALMHRVLWASRVAGRYERGLDPVDLAASSLGAYARPETVTALRRASSASQAAGLAVDEP